MPDGLLARVETAAQTSGESVNAFIVGAIEERLERREGGSTNSMNGECPHPKARVNKGLCGACGTYAGKGSGQ